MRDNSPNINKLMPLKKADVEKIFEFSPDIIFIHSDEIIQYVNKAGIKLLAGEAEDRLIGHSIWDIYPVDVHGLIRTRIYQVLESQGTEPFINLEIKGLEGVHRTVECANINIFYNEKPAVFVIMRDISANVLSQKLLNMQYSVSSTLVSNLSLENAITTAIKAICSFINADLNRIWVLDSSANLLICLAAWVKPSLLENEETIKILKPPPLPINQGKIGKAFYENKPFWNGNSDEKYHTTITIPIKSYETVMGIMEISFEKSIAKNEIMLDALMETANHIGAYIKRKKYENEIIFISNHDPVTGLINRYLFEQTLDSEVQLAKNNEQKLALLFLEINNFQSIKRRLGHAESDMLLRFIAERLLSLGFTIDHTSRIENERFAIIFRNIKDTVYITEEVAKINSFLSERFKLKDEFVDVETNIGVSIFPEDGLDTLELMKSADVALTIAIQAGSGKVQFSSLELTDVVWQRIKMENSIRHAFEKNEFYLVYQPIVDIKEFEAIGFEALLRWSQNGVDVPREIFIPMMEKSGIFSIIGEWIIREACKQCKVWQNKTSRPIYVSVNLSATELKNTNFASIVKNILNNLNFEAKCLMVEFTESTIMIDKKMSLQFVNEMRDFGIKVAIDDFGSGYSSLNYLVHLPIDFIKLDKVFIDEISSDPRVYPILRAAIELGESLNYQVIAEGVERKEQIDKLIALKCPYIQGYYFSKPMLGDEVTKFLKQRKINLGG